ncbi:hypothetical protein ASG72_16050 [Bosea sp. Leaf344]|uniref:DUF6356 family protein n=1 Tax=Bosea sp. Leaf344 TaxID=1736346 RepID=UPI00070069D1|nr:DUF6356 family protein [Bosea sp. Leaf344]KQU51270.1 hypothetical protein ASG72_16050 [Bosea sp. Leaf344]
MAERGVTDIFTRHPASVGESYTEHFGVAIRYSGRMFAAGFCALVHAFLPFLFEKTASGIVRRMVADMDRRTGTPAAAPQIVPAE